MNGDRRAPSWLVPALGAAIVVALVVVGLTRGEVELDPDSPEGTVQRYIDAIAQADYEGASAFWHHEGCLPESITPTRDYGGVSASLVRVDGGDDEAVVEVRITETTTDRFGNVSEYHEWFEMVRVDAEWRIRQPSWPYHDQRCEEAR